MNCKYPCIYCAKPVRKNQTSILCIQCNNWAHVKCGKVTDEMFYSSFDWTCNICLMKSLPFYSVDNAEQLKADEHSSKFVPVCKEKCEFANFPTQKGVKIAHLNMRSVRNKIDELRLFLKNNPYTIFTMSETWLDDDFPTGYLYIEDYDFERKDRINKSGGGVGAYISTKIRYKRRTDLENEALELMWLEIQPINCKPYLLGIVYRPPNSSVNFFEALEQNIENVNVYSDKIILTGDMNCNMLTTNSLSRKTTQLCNVLHLSQIVTQPTRITPNSESLIDLIFTSKMLGKLPTGVQSVSLSDHSLVYVTLKENTPKSRPRITVARSFRNFKAEQFLSDLNLVEWYTLKEESNVEEVWGKFKKSFLNVCNKHAPYVSIRKKTNPAPWITEEYLTLSRKRDYVKCMYNKTRQNSLWLEFKQLRNKANNLNKRLKKEYYSAKFKHVGKYDIKEKWRIVKDLLPSKKENNNFKLDINGKLIDNASEISNIFNSYFNSICDNLKDDNDEYLPSESQETFTDAETSFEFKHIDEEFVLRELKSIDCTKSHGIDEMHPKLLKAAADVVAKPLTDLFNLSLNTGDIPEDFLVAKIIPIHKSGAKTDPTNYRPISILSIVSRIFEKAVYNQLHNHAQENSLITPNQSGFRPLHSTETCLLDISEYLLSNMNEGYITGAIFLDLRKAFDVIPHNKLLNKLKVFGIRGKEHKWFTKYLTGRKHCVSINGTLSDFLSLKSGVPQGSTLGPLLFTLYINDLCFRKFSPSTKISLYADDTAIFCSNKTLNEVENNLQTQFNIVADWMSSNDMFINTSKTKVMLFGSRKKVKNKQISIKCKNMILENVSNMKYLGVIMDPTLKWTDHVDYIVKKICKTYACLRKVKPFVNTKSLIELYLSLIAPQIDYCCTVWGNKAKNNTVRLQRCQNKIARFILNVDWLTPTSHLLNTLHWQSVEQRIKYQQCVFVYKILTKKVPPYLNKLVVNRPVFYHTRYAVNSPLFIPAPRTQYMKTSFSYQAIILYNTLPLHVQSSSSIETFRKLCRTLSFTF